MAKDSGREKNEIHTEKDDGREGSASWYWQCRGHPRPCMKNASAWASLVRAWGGSVQVERAREESVPQVWEQRFVDLFVQGARGYAQSCLWATRDLMDRSGTGTERYPAFCCERERQGDV